MGSSQPTPGVALVPRRHLYVYNAGFLRQKRVRQILKAAGFDLRLGVPGAGDFVGVWGNGPTAYRGEAIAKWRGARLVRIEDGFLRSLHPGRQGEPPLGLMIDDLGVHFDGSRPSRLERTLSDDPLDAPELMERARRSMDRMQQAGLSKYAATDLDTPLPAPGFVLVIDQTAGDASVRASDADRQTFVRMLRKAREDHPGAHLLIKTHPETALGFRKGHFSTEDLPPGASFLTDPISPWALLARAAAVYTVSSQFGFDAIIAGHRPVVFGQPFYAGWGLSQDQNPPARRTRRLSREQLFAGAMFKSTFWFDPYDQQIGEFETALDAQSSMARAWRDDRFGWSARNIRLWKRRHFQQFFGRHRPVHFAKSSDPNRRIMTWGAKARAGYRVEDGFIRSRGLGAALVPPLSLVLDDLGIYYDPSRESRLERLLMGDALSAQQHARARELIARLARLGISKYNLAGAVPPLPAGHKILVIGQVQDDASVILGGNGHDNRSLLVEARKQNPQATIIWKPHPDVEAKLRPGQFDPVGLADVILTGAGAEASLAAVDEVWTISSLMGFEALVRELPVTCLGAPFYAGWGITRDLGPTPARRRTQIDLPTLVHRALIDYPRYIDPVTGLPCQIELLLRRLETGEYTAQTKPVKLLAKLQGFAATYGVFWR